jgi:hypothetical protein
MTDPNYGSMTNFKLITGAIMEGDIERLLLNYNQDGTQLKLNISKIEEVQIWLSNIRVQIQMIKQNFLVMKFTILMSKQYP